MSAAENRAVFLSYASQDADAARRICETLRSAGVEVWFDAEGGLEHGDEWDAKIRRQIKECVLFLPLVSANTQARHEGYFRLEWDLAAERARGIASGVAFILPVVIDDTREPDALVPDRFRTVQWTRLRGGHVPADVKARFLKLWSHRTGVLKHEAASGKAGPDVSVPATARDTVGKPGATTYALLAAGVAVVVAAAGWWILHRPAPPAATARPIAAAASPELAAIRARIVPDRWQKEDFETVSPMLDRAIQANLDSSDAWALRSIINTLQVTRNYDSGTGPLVRGQSDADRALRLAQGSPLAELAMGFHLAAMVSRGGDPQAGRPYLDRALAALPPDAITRYVDLIAAWQGYDLPRTARSIAAWLEADRDATMPAWIKAQMCIVQRLPDEAEKWAERAATDRNVTGVRAYYTIFESNFYLRADLAGSRAALERVPPTGRLVHRVVHGNWLVAMADRRWDEALQGLARVPEPFLFDRTYHGPRALLAGLAHQRAGRPEAAAAQFREAERLLREHLATDAENDELRAQLAVTLACEGRAADARNELAQVEPLVVARAPSIYRGPQFLPIAQARAILGDTDQLGFWLRKMLAEPSGMPVTPASLRLDPRFTGLLEAPAIQALLKEFAPLDRGAVAATTP